MKIFTIAFSIVVLAYVSSFAIAQDSNDAISQVSLTEFNDSDNIEIVQHLNGLKVITQNLEAFKGISVLIEYADKPNENSLLQPNWKTSEPQTFVTNKILFLDEFKLDQDYLYRLGLKNTKNNTTVWITEQKEFHSKSIIENIFVKEGENNLKVSWTVDYKLLRDLSNYGIQIWWNTDVDSKRLDKGFQGKQWSKSEILDIKTINYEITKLKDNEDYVVELAIVDKTSGHVWFAPKKMKVKTERTWGIVKFLMLLGSLGLFIYGMKVMSDGLQQAAGSKLRSWLRSITSNRVKGLLAGIGITSLVQSSSVTSVMTVSFVNAGLLTLRESIGVLLGANIGTTITAWLILLVGFKVSIDSYSLVFIALIFPLLFVAKGKSKSFALAVMGFALLFMGLGFLKASVPELDVDSSLVQFFLKYKEPTVLNRILFVFVGTLITIILQSSSAAMTLTMALVAKGILPFEIASAIILGENIGTTVTATLAASVGNVFSKRAARVHMVFNIIGVFWVMLIFPFFLMFVGWLVELIFGDPFDATNPEMANEGVAILHTAFNVINVFILIWFVPQLQRIAELTVKSKGAIDEEFRLEYIGGNVVPPDVSVFEAKRETKKYAEVTSRMNGFLGKLLVTTDKKEFSKLLKKIKKYEEITDRYEIEIANFLNKVSSSTMSEQNSEEVRALNSMANDLERIGDIYYQMSLNIDKKNEDKIWFSPEQRNGLLELSDLIEHAFQKMIANFECPIDQVNLVEAIENEALINKKRDKLRKQHLKNMQDEDYNMSSGLIYNDLFSSYERIGDHIINVTEALAGEI